MKKIAIILSFISFLLFNFSCNTDDLIRETIILIDEPAPNPDPGGGTGGGAGGGTGGGGTGGGGGTAVPNEDPAICENGFAGIFPCFDYDLVGHISLDNLEALSGNDCWGWTDPSNGKEYAIMGVDNGTVFIDISDPANPIYTAKVLTRNLTSPWRDIKVYNNYAFIVSEATNHGMQIFDLTRLRDSGPFDVLSPDAIYEGFGSAHNIVINEDSGFAYAVGSNTFGGGPHFVNIQNPLNPIATGGYSAGGYTHDAQVVIYNGPDTNFTGREIYFGANTNVVKIVDVTDKGNPQEIASILYSDIGYTHQCWLTEDHRFLIVGDELDELNFGFQSKTLIFDLENLTNPQEHFNYLGPTFAIDHNGYVNGNKFYLANYTAGIRIIDISFIGSSGILEEGYFDTYPDNDNASFNGVWSVYPFFNSGNIIISDINKGFFIVKKST